MDNKKIGAFIAQKRKEKGLTQQELGNLLYVTDKAVSKWERGLSVPDISLLEKLSNILDTSIYDILQISPKDNNNLPKLIKEQNLKLAQSYKRKNIFFICCFLIVLLAFILVIIFKPQIKTLIIKETNTIESQKTEAKEVIKNYLTLNTYLKMHNTSPNETRIVYSQIDNLYGIASQEVEESIGDTTYLFQYNYKTDNFFKITPQNNYKIIDFKIVDNKLYFINLKYLSKYIEWDLYITDLNFNNLKLITKGNILDESFPILILNNNELYLLATTLNNSQEITTLSKITKENISNLLNYEGNINTNQGSFLKIYNINIYEEKIWFTLNDNTLYVYNLNTEQLSKVFHNEKVTINHFTCNNKTCLINAYINNESKLISLNNQDYKIENLNIYNGHALNSEYLIFQDNDIYQKTPYKWYSYNTTNNSWENISNLTDSYWQVLKDNTILSIEDNKYYIIENVLDYQK